MNTLKFFYSVFFVIACIAIGQTLAIFICAQVYGLETSELIQLYSHPTTTDKSIIISLAVLYSLLSFLIIPTLYLLFRDRSLVSNLTAQKVQFTPLLLSIVSMITVLPLIAGLIALNESIELPAQLHAFEEFLKQAEESATRITNSMLNVNGVSDFLLVVVVMAIIPGIVEEVFFRGYVQAQFQRIFKNHHQAVLFASILFSLFHFQFYGFIPRVALGMLMGYLFVWSGNIWYSIAMHVVNNFVAICLFYFPEMTKLESKYEWLISALLSILSLAITIAVLFRVKNKLGQKVESSYNH